MTSVEKMLLLRMTKTIHWNAKPCYLECTTLLLVHYTVVRLHLYKIEVSSLHVFHVDRKEGSSLANPLERNWDVGVQKNMSKMAVSQKEKGNTDQ